MNCLRLYHGGYGLRRRRIDCTLRGFHYYGEEKNLRLFDHLNQGHILHSTDERSIFSKSHYGVLFGISSRTPLWILLNINLVPALDWHQPQAELHERSANQFTDTLLNSYGGRT